MNPKERLLSAVVDIQNYIKHDVDQATCAACPRWDELQAAAMSACDEIDRLCAEAERVESLKATCKQLLQVQRYELVYDELQEDDDGDWVRWIDITAALRGEGEK